MQQRTAPTLILVRGLPGSGKSYLAQALQQRLGDQAEVLDPDTTDYNSAEYAAHVAAQNRDGVDPALHAYRFLRARAYKAIEQHKYIIWNQPFRNLDIFQQMVGRLHDHAAAHQTTLDIVVVEVQLDADVARSRVVARKQAGGHGPSDSTFDRFISEFKSFAGMEYQLVTVNGDADVESSVDQVIAALPSQSSQ